ncbi:MAG: hypothetical protein AAGK00_13110 [Pseudomonadota bacterium]
MALFDRSLWPDQVRSPYLRLGLALVLSPLLMCLLVASLGFLVGAVSESNRDAVIDYGMGVLPYLLGAMIAFMLTFGMVGVLALWAFTQRSLIVWALTGAFLGACAGVVVTLFGGDPPYWRIPAVFGLLGWMLFLLIRGIAGIRTPKRRAESSLESSV